MVTIADLEAARHLPVLAKTRPQAWCERCWMVFDFAKLHRQKTKSVPGCTGEPPWAGGAFEVA